MGGDVLERLAEINVPVNAGERIDHVAFENGRLLAGRIGDKVGRMLDDSGRQPFAIVDGVALIPIEGTLVHKGAYVGAYSGRTMRDCRRRSCALGAILP
jgi:hypothetical protein